VLRHLHFSGTPTRVALGAGARGRLGTELDRLGSRRALVLSTATRRADAEPLAAALGARSLGILDLAREHVPVEIVREARAGVARLGADALVAFGGGSTIGLAKAIALEHQLPIVSLPTTFSGSEMTPIWGITEDGAKRTGRDERSRAAAVLYDPELSLAMPAAIAVTSAFNALAHAVEALYAADADAETLLWAELGARALVESLPELAGGAASIALRERAFYGSCLAGVCLGRASMGLHHKLCHVLGGSFGLPHAATHAALLPYVADFNLAVAPEARVRLGRALSAANPAKALFDLAELARVPLDLASLGLSREALPRAVELTLASPYENPRALSAEALSELLERAHRGQRAASAVVALSSPAITDYSYKPGFGSTFESEVLPGALPRQQNSPQHCPYGLYAELLSGTPFTVRRAQNRRSWLYKIRPSFTHGDFVPLGARRFCHEFLESPPNKLRWRPPQLPGENESVDWLDGLTTLGGWGQPGELGYAIHLYAANAPMQDRCFIDADGDLLVVPQHGALDCHTEFGRLRVTPGEVLLLGRGMKVSIAPAAGGARGYALEVFGRSLELPERGLIGSNGLADARHFLAPVAWFEDRDCAGYQVVTKFDGALYAASQNHSPFDVVAWHGNYAPYKYDLSAFNALGTVTFDHPDPSLFTVLTCPYDDHGRSIADFVVFPPRWQVAEHSFRPPFHHRNAATEVNCILKNPDAALGFEPGCAFLTPLLTAHGIATRGYEAELERREAPVRIPDDSLWFMFESSLPFRLTSWALETPLLDRSFGELFTGVKKRFDPKRP
jgi:homogentisate 1,2-dioxygenase